MVTSGNPIPGKKKKPCDGPGCTHPNYHVCPKKMGPDTFPDLLGLRKNKAEDGNVKRWAAHRAANAGRDAKIVELYEQRQFSMNRIVKELGVHKDAVIKVLHEASEAGLVTIRKVGRPGPTT